MKPIDTTARTVEALARETERSIEPFRNSVFKRFPTLFTLLVTFGVAATFFGFERFFEVVPFFNDHPISTLVIGLTILVLTGKLYAKLG
jgi:hypothetical protein